MLWTEKYRPTKLGDIVGQEHLVMDANGWVEEGNIPNLLFYGNAGLGKTTVSIVLANAILKDGFKDNFFEINASDDRKLEVVRTKIKEIAQSGAIGEVPFRIILLDEMDGMTPDAQNALKRIMERYSSNVRFIITCNDKNKIIFALQSRCANYRFKNLNTLDMQVVVSKILENEGVTHFDSKELRTFIGRMNGDLRRAITELQAVKASGSTLQKQVEYELEEYMKILNMIVNKNTNALGQIHDLLYDGRSMKEICIGLHDSVVESTGLDHNIKFKFLRTIGETEWRSTTMTPKVLASWMVGQLI